MVVKRKISQNKRNVVNADLYHQEVTLEYTIENFKTDALTLDITEEMNNLRNSLCGGKGRTAEWEIVTEGTTIGRRQIERKDATTAIFHIPLKAAPEGGDAKVEPVTVKVHLFLRNEW